MRITTSDTPALIPTHAPTAPDGAPRRVHASLGRDGIPAVRDGAVRGPAAVCAWARMAGLPIGSLERLVREVEREHSLLADPDHPWLVHLTLWVEPEGVTLRWDGQWTMGRVATLWVPTSGDPVVWWECGTYSPSTHVGAALAAEGLVRLDRREVAAYPWCDPDAHGCAAALAR